MTLLFLFLENPPQYDFYKWKWALGRGGSKIYPYRFNYDFLAPPPINTGARSRIVGIGKLQHLMMIYLLHY
jgi:hypothetical protein